jgi:putative FmdB family regulatory protein
MPIYEYQCTACGHMLEAFQDISDAPLTDCPTCHKTTLDKLVSAPSFQLKGTGWYATDFRNKPTTNGDTSQSKSDTPSDSSTSSTDKGTT